MSHKPFKELILELQQEVDPYYNLRHALWHLPQGSLRRNEIYKRCPPEGIRVNAKYCLQINKDRDLQKLIKTGKMKIRKEGIWLGSRQTYLVRT